MASLRRWFVSVSEESSKLLLSYSEIQVVLCIFQVYIPLLKAELPTALAIIRNLGTLAAVFGVVLAWHGTRKHYICWVEDN